MLRNHILKWHSKTVTSAVTSLIVTSLLVFFHFFCKGGKKKSANDFGSWIDESFIHNGSCTRYGVKLPNITHTQIPRVCSKNQCVIENFIHCEYDWYKDELLGSKWLQDSWNANASLDARKKSIMIGNIGETGFYSSDKLRIIFELSDEGFKTFDSVFDAVEDENVFHIFRNYATTKFCAPRFENRLTVLPLGYTKGYYYDSADLKNRTKRKDHNSFLTDYIKSSNRKYGWSFFGNLASKPWRQEMLDAMNSSSLNYKLYTNPGFGQEMKFIGDVRVNYLQNSVYCPCPKGWWNADTFRFTEAMESGCIPIIDDKEHYFEAFFSMYGLDINDFGVVRINNLKNESLAEYLDRQMQNKTNIDIRQQTMMRSYYKFKTALKQHVDNILFDFCCEDERASVRTQGDDGLIISVIGGNNEKTNEGDSTNGMTITFVTCFVSLVGIAIVYHPGFIRKRFCFFWIKEQ